VRKIGRGVVIVGAVMFIVLLVHKLAGSPPDHESLYNMSIALGTILLGNSIVLMSQ